MRAITLFLAFALTGLLVGCGSMQPISDAIALAPVATDEAKVEGRSATTDIDDPMHANLFDVVRLYCLPVNTPIGIQGRLGFRSMDAETNKEIRLDLGISCQPDPYIPTSVTELPSEVVPRPFCPQAPPQRTNTLTPRTEGYSVSLTGSPLLRQ